MMKGSVMRAAVLAAMLVAVVLSSSGAAAQACNCTHLGGSVACPAGLPAGS